MDARTVRQRLVELAEESYRTFSAKLTPGANMLGVRLPTLRKLAKAIAKEDCQTYLDQAWDEYHEEVLLQGLVIGAAQADTVTRLRWIGDFLPKITNWAICDSFVTSLRWIAKQPEAFLPLITECLASDQEFYQRFAFVTYLAYYVQAPYLPQIFQACEQCTHQGYYVKMAVAWLLSVCYAKFPQETDAYLRGCALPDDTFRMTLQKIRDSRRVTPARKAALPTRP